MKLKYISGGICAPTGFTAGATYCGVRPNKKKNDLAIILSDRNAAGSRRSAGYSRR